MKKIVAVLLLMTGILTFSKIGNKEDKEFFVNITKLSDEYYEYGRKEFGENFGCPTIGYFLIIYKMVKEIDSKDIIAEVSLKLARTSGFIKEQTGKYPTLSLREFLEKYYGTECKYPVKEFFTTKEMPEGLDLLFRKVDIPELDDYKTGAIENYK